MHATKWRSLRHSTTGEMSVSSPLEFEVIDAAGTKKVFVLHAERERPAAVSFVDRDLQLLVVGQRETLEGEDHALRPVATHTHRLVVGTQGLQHAFLDSRSFDHFLVDDFEGDHVDRIRQVGLVFYRQVEVEEVVVDVQAAKQELSRADMADGAALL